MSSSSSYLFHHKKCLANPSHKIGLDAWYNYDSSHACYDNILGRIILVYADLVAGWNSSKDKFEPGDFVKPTWDPRVYPNPPLGLVVSCYSDEEFKYLDILWSDDVTSWDIMRDAKKKH